MTRIDAVLLIVTFLLAGPAVYAADPFNKQSACADFPGIETDIQYDSDQLSWLVAPGGVRNRKKDHDPEGAMTGRVLHSIRDFNGDGHTNLLVQDGPEQFLLYPGISEPQLFARKPQNHAIVLADE